MRSLRRSIARARMEQAGVSRINKRRIWDDKVRKEKTGPNKGAWIGEYRSYFAMNWRKYLDPKTKEYKWAMNGLTKKKRPGLGLFRGRGAGKLTRART